MEGSKSVTRKSHSDKGPGDRPRPPEMTADESPDPPQAEPRPTVSVTEHETALAEAADYKDRWLHAAADYDNLRKRMAREREQIVCSANERLISDLLPILDNLERAIEALPDAAPAQGIADGV